MPGISSVKAVATGRTIPERVRSDPTSVFDDVQSTLTESDLLLGTLECPLTDSYPYDDRGSTPFLLGPERAAEALTDVDFDCLSLATNHVLDHGEETAETTVRILREHGLEFVGDPFGLAPEREFMSKGRTIAVGGFNLCDQGPWDRREDLFAFVDRNAGSDLTILLVHWGWGFEHLRDPSSSQIELGHDLVDAGADLVLGTHSHVFQPVEHYNGGVIAYSLGNFLFDMWRPENQRSGILKLVQDETASFDVSITPVETADGVVSRSDRSVDDMVRDEPPVVPSTIDRDATLKNLRHNLEIVGHYLRYSPRLPGAYHRENVKRWSRKLTTPREVFR